MDLEVPQYRMHIFLVRCFLNWHLLAVAVVELEMKPSHAQNCQTLRKGLLQAVKGDQSGVCDGVPRRTKVWSLP